MRVRFINKRKLILIVICIFLGLIVAYQETVYFRANEVEYVPIVILKEDVSVNTVLTEGQLEYKNYPQSLINGEFTQNIEEVTGNYLARNIKAGTPLYVSDISTKKTVVIPEGMVRVTFLTNLQDGLAGVITPGTYINLGFVSKDGQVAKPLFSNVLTVKITDKTGTELNNGKIEKKTNAYANKDVIPATVTVVLGPEDSVLLKQHEALGRIFIMGH